MDSRDWWSRAYSGPMAPSDDAAPSGFAIETDQRLSRRCRILELGCGLGYDAAYLARQGHQVVAGDFIRLAESWRRWSNESGSSPRFVLLDLRIDLPFQEAHFDLVYARLSLHYFSSEVTRRIFAEVHRVLVPGGLFVFMCKSTHDPGYGRGEPVGRNMFRINDKVYHFFDEDFARESLGSRFRIDELRSGPCQTYGEASDVVRARATKLASSPSDRSTRGN